MPKYNLFYNLLICSTNAVWLSVVECEKMGNVWRGLGNNSPILFLLDIV